MEQKLSEAIKASHARRTEGIGRPAAPSCAIRSSGERMWLRSSPAKQRVFSSICSVPVMKIDTLYENLWFCGTFLIWKWAIFDENWRNWGAFFFCKCWIDCALGSAWVSIMFRKLPFSILTHALFQPDDLVLRIGKSSSSQQKSLWPKVSEFISTVKEPVTECRRIHFLSVKKPVTETQARREKSIGFRLVCQTKSFSYKLLA